MPMSVVLLVARLLLAAVFAVGGIAKLFDRAGSRQAMGDFGLPERLTVPAGLLLPLGELTVAVLLVPARTAWVGAVAALALLTLFICGIGVTLARGRRPDCHCFGQLHSAPVGWRTVGRNGLLAGVAGFILVAGHGNAGIDVLAWLGGDTMAAWVALGLGIGGLVVSAVFLWLLLQLVAQNGRLLKRLDRLELQLAQVGWPGTRASGTAGRRAVGRHPCARVPATGAARRGADAGRVAGIGAAGAARLRGPRLRAVQRALARPGALAARTGRHGESGRDQQRQRRGEPREDC